MYNILEKISELANKTLLDKVLIKEIVAPVCIIVGALIIYMISKKVIKDIFRRKNKHYEKRKHETIISILNNIIKYVLIVIAFIMILNVFGVNTQAILASLGLIGVVLGLALQDTLKDILAGVGIIFENQFAIGDNIEIGTFRGDVISMGLKTTKIRAYSGEVKMIANRNIIEVINHSLATSLAIVDVGISYDTKLDKVEKVLNELCERLSNELPDLVGDVTLLGINELGDSAIIYRITAETKSMQQFVIERKIRREVKLALDQNKIEIPFPQIEVHNG